MPYDVGDSVTVTGVFTDVGGTLANPTTTTLQVTSPSGSVTLYTYGVDGAITNPGTGTFVGLLALGEAGYWTYRWRGVTGSYTPTAFGTLQVTPSFTYSGNPATSSRDLVRFLIGDTDATSPLLTDAEVAWLVSAHTTSMDAAIQACEMLAAKFARMPDIRVDDVSISGSQRAKQFSDLKASLVARTTSGGVAAYVGGISVADKQIAEDDSDAVQPFFTREWTFVTDVNASRNNGSDD